MPDRSRTAARKALRVTSPMRRQAFVDMLGVCLDLTSREASEALDDLVEGGCVVVRGHATAALVYPCPKLGA